MTSPWFVVGAVAGACGVALGAFGAHALKSRVGPEMLAVFETGVRYHLVHALALVIVGLAASRWPGAWITAAGWLFLAGIVLFGGSLVAMALGAPRWLGAITPLGGLSYIVGWICLALAAWRGAGRG
jgi:uncharacterized membrane protein YgdD (TMEM256/DUF423 family)